MAPWAVAFVLAFSGFSAAAAEDDERELVPCPTCEASGREKCPDCAGRGKIYNPCSRCDGKGTRRCSVCNNPDNDGNSELTPGSVPCGACGGRGRLGAVSPRACGKCGGQGRITCLTCLGDGQLRCKKEVFDRVCSRCRVSGKITCRTCGGTKAVPRDFGKPAGVKALELDQPAVSTSSDDAVVDVHDGRSLSDRFSELDELYSAARARTLEDPRPKLLELYMSAGKRQEALAHLRNRETTGENLPDPRRVRSRAAELRLEWNRFLDAYEEFERTFVKCRSLFEKEADYEARTEWEKDAGLVLRIAENSARRLQTFDGAAYLEETTALEKQLEDLQAEIRRRSEEEAETEAAEPAPEAAALPGETAASSPPSGGAARAAAASGNSPQAASPPNAGSPLVAREEAAPAGRPSGFLSGAVWGALAAFAVAAGIYFTRRKTSAQRSRAS